MMSGRGTSSAARRPPLLTLGRFLLGLAVMGFGGLSLLYVDFVNALQPVPSGLPGYAFFAVATGLVLMATGAALALRRQERAAALVVAGFFALCIAVLQVPSAFTNPELLRSPWWIRTFESLALIGGAITLAGWHGVPMRDGWIRAGRVAFGVSLPVFGTLHLVYPESVAALVPPWYPWPLFWAWFTGAAQIAGGIAIASGVLSRVAAILAGAMYGGWALTLHVPRSWCRLYGPCGFMDPPVGLEGSRGGLTSLFVAVAMCGAAWIVAGAHERGRDQDREVDQDDYEISSARS